MRRVFEVDVLLCGRCGGRRRIVTVYPGGPRRLDLLARLGRSPPAGLPPPRGFPDLDAAPVIIGSAPGGRRFHARFPSTHSTPDGRDALRPRGPPAAPARPPRFGSLLGRLRQRSITAQGARPWGERGEGWRQAGAGRRGSALGIPSMKRPSPVKRKLLIAISWNLRGRQPPRERSERWFPSRQSLRGLASCGHPSIRALR